MKRIVWILLLSIATSSFAADLPDAPSAAFTKATSDRMAAYLDNGDVTILVGDTCIGCVESDAPDASQMFSPPRLSFSERHRKAIIWTGIGIGVAIGAIVGILKHSGNCPSRIFYEGEWYPYSGTYDDQHACPTEPPGVH